MEANPEGNKTAKSEIAVRRNDGAAISAKGVGAVRSWRAAKEKSGSCCGCSRPLIRQLSLRERQCGACPRPDSTQHAQETCAHESTQNVAASGTASKATMRTAACAHRIGKLDWRDSTSPIVFARANGFRPRQLHDRAGPFLGCRACSSAGRCKSSSQRDGRELTAKRNGVVVRRVYRKRGAKARADVQQPDLRHTVLDERASDREVRIHQRHWL
jgi:hypothetical protein